MIKAITITRYSLIILSGILLLIAVGSSVAAILTPAWQTVYLAEFQSEHEHGLWIDCTITKKLIKGWFICCCFFPNKQKSLVIVYNDE